MHDCSSKTNVSSSICKISTEQLKLKLFPLPPKDKAKTQLRSLRPNSIGRWNKNHEMHEEFVKKFFSSHQTIYLRKYIISFIQKDNETFFDRQDHFKELILLCPHHEFEIWRSVNIFYQGLNTITKQFIEMIFNGEFPSKDGMKHVSTLFSY